VAGLSARAAEHAEAQRGFEAEIVRLTQVNTATVNEAEELATALQEATQSLATEQQATGELRRQYERAQAELARLCQEKAALTKEAEEQAANLQVSTQSLHAMAEANNHVQTKYKAAIKAAGDLHQQVSEFEAATKRHVGDKGKLAVELEQALSNAARYATEKDAAAAEVAALRGRVVDFESEMEMTRDKAGKETARLLEQKSELAAAQRVLKTQIARLTQANSAMTKEAEERATALQAATDSLATEQQAAQASKRQTEKAQAELARLSQEKAALNIEAEEGAMAIQATTQSLQAATETQGHLQMKYATALKAACDLREQVSDLEVAAARHIARKDELAATKESLALELESSIFDKNSLNERVSDLTKQMQAYEGIHQISKVNHAAELELSQNIAFDLTFKLESTESLLVERNSDLQNLLLHRDHLKRQVNDLNTSLKRVEELKFKKMVEYDSLAAKLSNVTALRDHLDAEKQSLMCNMKSKQSEIDSLKTQNRELVDEVMTLTSSQVKHYDEILESKKDLESKQGEISSLSILIEDLTNQLQSSQAKYDNEISFLSLQTKDLAARAKKLKCQVERIEAQLDREKSSHEITKSQLRVYKIKICYLSNGLEAAKAALDTKESKLLEIVKKLDAHVTDKKEKEEELQGLFSLVRAQESQIKKGEANCDNLEAKLKLLIPASQEKEICHQGSPSKENLSAAEDDTHLLSNWF